MRILRLHNNSCVRKRPQRPFCIFEGIKFKRIYGTKDACCEKSNYTMFPLSK